MSFTKITAPLGPRTEKVLSADNSPPERHIVIDTVRKAAPLLGLRPSVVATLETLLSCLAPKRNHHTVFASNATLTFRRHGISDRTLRRHVQSLQDAGLLNRQDSPNKKRFTRHSKAEGKTLRFGFDLTPLFDRLQEIARLATAAAQEQDQIKYLRCKLRAAANATLLEHPNDASALNTMKLLRRKLGIHELQMLVDDLEPTACETRDASGSNPSDTPKMTANDGQYVRHHHKSNIDNTNKEDAKPEKQTSQHHVSIPELILACPEAMQFSLGKITTPEDVIAHAQTLAPMLGIDNASYHAAQTQKGSLGAAVTVWALLEFHQKIGSVGAYFRSITSGRKSAGFDPFELVKTLVRKQTAAFAI